MGLFGECEVESFDFEFGHGGVGAEDGVEVFGFGFGESSFGGFVGAFVVDGGIVAFYGGV